MLHRYVTIVFMFNLCSICKEWFKAFSAMFPRMLKRYRINMCGQKFSFSWYPFESILWQCLHERGWSPYSQIDTMLRIRQIDKDIFSRSKYQRQCKYSHFCQRRLSAMNWIVQSDTMWVGVWVWTQDLVYINCSNCSQRYLLLFKCHFFCQLLLDKNQ